MRSVELPPICPDGSHEWVMASVHGCGALPDDQAVDEAIVLIVRLTEPLTGGVCNSCFQLWGEGRGVRHLGLQTAYEALSAWE